ncbi:uncharacterized protein LOC132554276 [Ylistrum balloti]|uniref:uncharacterized protein LOC132554276 n=1 Tax=Ylistrum balloti TaxID=509963 RepID=UPI002905872B|nr:uncharacterized protein LOC132554276 [Ylistrum balloti]
MSQRKIKTVQHSPISIFLKTHALTLFVIAARAHADQIYQADDKRHSSPDDSALDYVSLMDRLERQEESIRQLQAAVAEKAERIERLENRLQDNKTDIEFRHRQDLPATTVTDHLQPLSHFPPNRHQAGNVKNANTKTFFTEDYTGARIDKRQSTNTNVAFSASMTNSVSVHQHETLVFGHVLLNEGNGYNGADGIFIVPRGGVYVFTWSITSAKNNDGTYDIHTSLLINGSPVGAIDSDADSNNWGSATGIVVVAVENGDHVFVRMATGSSGSIISQSETKSTFSGWFLF